MTHNVQQCEPLYGETERYTYRGHLVIRVEDRTRVYASTTGSAGDFLGDLELDIDNSEIQSQIDDLLESDPAISATARINQMMDQS